MGTILGVKFDLTFNGKPPGMSREDFLIWENYKKDIDPNYEAIYFNVHVGEGTDPGENTDEKMRQFWKEKTQLRIDVFIVYKDRVAIVELRHNASPTAVGRLFAYLELYRDDDLFKRPIVLELATNQFSEVVAKVCNSNQIVYRVL